LGIDEAKKLFGQSRKKTGKRQQKRTRQPSQREAVLLYTDMARIRARAARCVARVL
jgi:hypothetical protein